MSVFAPFDAGFPSSLRLPRDFDSRKHRRNLTRLIALHERWPDGEFTVDGISLQSRHAVFNPVLGSFSRILCRVVGERVGRNARVLDLGTGSGYLAIRAARQGARVIGTDSNESLETLIARNCAANGVQIDFRPSRADELFARTARHEQFDFIVANLPFSRAPLVRDFGASAYYDCFAAPAGLVHTLITGGMSRLAPGGELLFCYGSSGWMDELESAIAATRAEIAIHWIDQTPTRSEWRFVFGLKKVL